MYNKAFYSFFEPNKNTELQRQTQTFYNFSENIFGMY